MLGARAHHFGARPRRPIGLPRALVDVAGGPPIDPIPFAPIAGECAVVALAFPRSLAPDVRPVAVFPVGHELALVAIAVRPCLHPPAILAPRFETATVLSRAFREALSLRQPADAGPAVDALNLGVQNLARLRLNGKSQEQASRDQSPINDHVNVPFLGYSRPEGPVSVSSKPAIAGANINRGESTCIHVCGLRSWPLLQQRLLRPEPVRRSKNIASSAAR